MKLEGDVEGDVDAELPDLELSLLGDVSEKSALALEEKGPAGKPAGGLTTSSGLALLGFCLSVFPVSPSAS